jgi:hypothetical protein
LLLAGCAGSGSAPKTAPVSGKIVLANGEPLTRGIIVFHPKDPPGNEARAFVAKDGSFKLSTFLQEDGAVPGRYVVTVEPIANQAPGGQVKVEGIEVRIPKRYWSEEKSPLKVEVKAGENTLGPFRLQ